MSFDAAWATLEEMLLHLVALFPNLIVAIVLLVLSYFAARLSRRFVRRFVHRMSLAEGANLILGRLSQWLIMFLGLLVSLMILFPSFDAGQLIELLGIGGVAIGFAFRDIVQNFLAGILLLLTQPFRLDDQIRVGDYEGTVEDIQTRATLLKTYDGRRVVIPNADLFTQSVIVNTAYPIRRTEYSFGIGYNDDVSRAAELIVEAISEVDQVLTDPAPDVRLAGLGDFSVSLLGRWWTDSRRSDVVDVQDQVLAKVKIRLTQAGIDLPFPTQHILLHDQTEETDGDRTRQREGWPADPHGSPAPATLSRSLETLAAKLGS